MSTPPYEATVHNQAELDKALAAKTRHIYIQSPPGLWLKVHDSDSSSVVACGSSSVVARGSSSVVAWDSSSVVAWDSSSVVAWDSSSVVAWDSSSVVARGSSSVVARGSSSVVAWDSSSVVAWDSSSVVARGSSSVVARGSSSVVARGSSSVVARGSFVVVRQKPHHRGNLDAHDAVVVDERNTKSITDFDEWVDKYGAKREGDTVTLFKAVGDEFQAGESWRLTHYVPGTVVDCPDWQPTAECGYGLHFGPTASCATFYRRRATRWVEVEVDVADVVVIPDYSGDAPKIKAKSCRVVREVDRRGRPLAEEVAP